MDIFEAIDTRHTTRKFDSYKPTVDEAKRIINSARLAPSAINAQNWKFIAVFDDNVKEKMASAVLDAYSAVQKNLDNDLKEKVERYKGHSTFFKNAPLVIVCILEDAPAFMEGVLEKADFSYEEIKAMRPDSYLLSMGGAIENMLLSAHGLGLSGCWMVAPVLGVFGMNKALGLSYNQRIVSIVSIGKEAIDATSKRSPKKNLDEIMQII